MKNTLLKAYYDFVVCLTIGYDVAHYAYMDIKKSNIAIIALTQWKHLYEYVFV